jgi:hypothetical protein
MTDQGAGDLAAVLASEFDIWFRTLGARGFIPRAFTGVTKEGKQAVVILTGLTLDHVQRREFLIWLCRTEQFVAYAYGTHVAIAADSTSPMSEGIDIYASSDCYDVSKSLQINRLADGTHTLLERHHAVLEASPDNGLFWGLQRLTDNIPSDNQVLFGRLWRDIEPNARWRQR